MGTSPGGMRSEGPRLGTAAIVAVGAACLVLALALAVYLYDHSRREVIASGVSIDGVAVGGLHAAVARTKVEHDLLASLNRRVTVRSGSRTWTLDAHQAHLSVGVSNMVDQAVAVSRQGSIVTRTARGLFGGSVHRNIPLVVTYSHQAVRERGRAGPRRREPCAERRERAAECERTDGGSRAARRDGGKRGAGRARGGGAPRREREPNGAGADARGPAGGDDRAAGCEAPAYIVVDRTPSACASTNI